jgi:serine/threonine-protein kinase
VAARRVLIVDPAGRHGQELARAAAANGLVAHVVERPTVEDTTGAELALVTVGAAGSLADSGFTLPRWVIGEPGEAGKLAGAAVACAAAGVLLLPVDAAILGALVASEPGSPESEQARLRSLLAVSLLDEGDPAAPLVAIAAAFTADDCVLWWRDGDQMVPRGSRPAPPDSARPVAAAARIAAATGATVIGGGRSVIAAPLRSGPSEVAGLLAVVRDRPRRFSTGERADLRALAARLTRELQHLASYRRLVAEDEKLRAGSLHDPLTSALTRAAFEQAVANEVAAATRRGEPLSMLFLDIVGLRKINLQHGHRAGDEVLAQVANRIRAAVRGTDLLGRFGGDELALLFINAGAEQARIAAEKAVARITAGPVNFEDAAIAVAVRAVVAPIAAAERSGEASFARALGILRASQPNKVAIVPTDARPPEGDVPLEHAALGVGTTVGGTYRILHELSRGAMGVVYRGEDIGLGRPVAIKVLRSDLASDAELVTRFRAEAAMLASLHHPNLVQVYALGEHAGDVYFVMELVEGQPLSDLLRSAIERGEWLPLPVIGHIAIEIADALDAMHQVGLIHRDVKPGNVLLDRDKGRAVLVDVGVATRAGARGEGAGTPGFAAPESFTGDPSADGAAAVVESPATDVYGLAATVFCMLTGRTPFGSGKVMAVVSRQLNEPLTPASQHRPILSRAVDEVLTKALDPNPKKRWASASAFAVAMARALERIREEPDATPPAELTPLAPPSTPRQPTAPAERAAALVTEVLPAGLARGDETPVRPQPPIGGGAPSGDIRGAHFRVAARGLSSRLGGAAVRNLVEASPVLARVLAPSLPALGWEPVDAFLELCTRAEPVMPSEDLAWMIGRATIHATFARFFGANPASLPVETVMRASPAFWGRYHTWSRLQLALSASRHTELILEQPVAVPALCALTAAQLVRVAELAGAKEAMVDHGMCRARGHTECRFVVTWSA